MDIDAGDNERKVTKERIELVDKLILSPEQRTMKVFDVIQNHNRALDLEDARRLDNWDLLCYSISHIVSLANVYTWLQLPAKHLKNLAFNAHYLYPTGHGLIKNDNGIQPK